VLARRAAAPPAARASWSESITRHLIALGRVQAAGTVLAYLSFGDELDTHAFVDWLLAQGKRLALPRVNREARRLDLFLVSDPASQTAAGTWGIREPVLERCEAVDLAQIDLILVPGVAFTAAGARLGYGGGYYDRLIASGAARPPTIAAAFGLQIVAELPLSPSDVAVDLVITEAGPLTGAAPR
jgi:5-formyltetrahydrofolate cyclo-ligase